MDTEYETVSWLTTNENNVYIHRLAAHPDYQGKGLAQFLITFAEEFTRKNRFISSSLDTFSQNPRNLKFYLKRGYKKQVRFTFQELKTILFIVMN